MRYYFIFSFVLLCNLSAFCQTPKTIRFIHRGEELKPIGTLVIGVDTLSSATDKKFDYIFGKSVKTDLKSARVIEKFINTSTFLVKNPKVLKDSKEFYEIVNLNGSKIYLGEKNFSVFFRELRNELNLHALDHSIYKAFLNY